MFLNDPSQDKKLNTEEIHRAFRDALMGFLVKRVRDPNLADDLFQETLLKIHTKLPELRDSKKITAWVFQIARNVLTDHHRKKRPTFNSAMVEALEVEDENAISDQPAHLAMAGCVRGMVDTLPLKYRSAIAACDFSEQSQTEVAEALGISLPALKSRLKRGREALKEVMGTCCRHGVNQSCSSKTSSTSCGCQEFEGAI